MALLWALLPLAHAARVATHVGKTAPEGSLQEDLNALVTRDGSWAKLLIERHGTSSIFEQTRYHFEDLGYVSMLKDLGYYNNNGFVANWSSTGFGLSISFKGEKGVDAFGLRKEWLQLVLESIVIPKELKDEGKGLECLCHQACVEGPQYLLESLPSGKLIPIISEKAIGSAPAAEEASWAQWLWGKVVGTTDTDQTGRRFRFLGKWIARAYVVSGLGYSPFAFHPWIYESLLAGEVQKTTTEGIYSEADTIFACEELVKIYQRRSPQEMKAYGWQSCNELIDPENKTYLQESCRKPIYRDEQTWEYLYTEWGPLAGKATQPHEPTDLVSFADAKEHTQLQCEALLEQFVEPVQRIIEGFNEVIPRDNESFSFFWDQMSSVQNLQDIVEGDPEVDLDAMIASADFDYWGSEKRKKLFISVLEDFAEEGEGLQITEKPLNRLLRFFTGSYTAPVGGWESLREEYRAPLSFTLTSTYGKKCAPLKGKTCFNELIIPKGCVKNKKTLKNIIKESTASMGFGMD